MIPYLYRSRLGRGFWTIALYFDKDSNPVFAVSHTPQAFGIWLGRWTYIHER